MVEFMRGYEPPMDRQFDEEPIETLEEQSIEAPIVPISEIGSTVLDNAANKHILQNVEEKIRLGAKKIQLILSGSQQGMSALASGHGKDVRRELKEKAKATGIEITGVELSPQRIQGLSGFDGKSGSISEEQRQQNLNEVRYAVQFAADVSEGGGVDVLSNEFQRNIIGADWHEKEKKAGYEFYDHDPKELTSEGLMEAGQLRYLIDKRTGQPVQQSAIRTNTKIHRVEYQTAEDKGKVGERDASGRILKPSDLVDVEGNYIDPFDEEKWRKAIPKIDPETRQYKMEAVDWNMLQKETEKYNKGLSNGEKITVEEYAFRQRMESQRAQLQGQAYYWGRQLEAQYEQLESTADLKKLAKNIESDMSEEQRQTWIRDNVLARLSHTPIAQKRAQKMLNMNPSDAVDEWMRAQQHEIYGGQEQVRSYMSNLEEVEDIMDHVETQSHYAKQKVFESYKDAGMYAFKKTKEENLKKPVYVGPEIGWAGQSYGGHPEEFKEIILKSREEMAKELKKQGYAESEAKSYAKKHIKGMLDTSHVSMWYKHMKQKEGESEEQKLKRFNKWMKERVGDLVDSDVIGGVQLVDSITGEHSHLPAGQGIFDMSGVIKEMKKKGFDGPIVSEGHEEDGYSQGRILTETWRALGSPITSVSPGQRGGLSTWGGIQHSYMGHRSSPSYIVGAYVPSNEWQLWSDTPFE